MARYINPRTLSKLMGGASEIEAPSDCDVVSSTGETSASNLATAFAIIRWGFGLTAAVMFAALLIWGWA